MERPRRRPPWAKPATADDPDHSAPTHSAPTHNAPTHSGQAHSGQEAVAEPAPAPTRRTVLAGMTGLGLTGLGLTGVAIGAAGLSGCQGQPSGTAGDEADRPLPVRATAADWIARRGTPFYIAHRGAGTVVPEHTLESYRQALDWGADCVEVSSALTGDGDLICLHDLTYDRTTTATGEVFAQPSEVFRSARVRVPRLGPRWMGAGMPRVPLLEDALRLLRGRAVVCLEAKDERGFDAMLDLVRRLGMQDAVIIKLYVRTVKLAQAQDAGYPVFLYVGAMADLDDPGAQENLRRLRPDRDLLVIPAVDQDAPLRPEPVRQAGRYGVPLVAYPVHRRSEADALRALGIHGFVTPDVGYLAGTVAPLRRDQWAQRAICSGELSKDPYADTFALKWADDGLLLAYPGRPAFVCLGQFGALDARRGFRIDVDLRYDPLPSDPAGNVSIAFGHASDEYYAHRDGRTNGYHAILRVDGSMAVFRHQVGARDGTRITAERATAPLRAGQWTTVSLSVRGTAVTWGRVGSRPLSGRLAGPGGGGYIHIGRSASDGPLALRGFVVSDPVS